MALRQLSEAERDEIKRNLEESLTPFAAEGWYELPGLVLVCSGYVRHGREYGAGGRG